MSITPTSISSIPLTEIRACLECGDSLRGRTDKKFCSDHCRTAYHNRLNGPQTNYVRCINLRLRKNRRILMALNAMGRSKINGSELRERGFDFAYFTHLRTRKDGAICYYCYEQGYRAMNKERYVLVVKQDLSYELDS